MLVVQDALLAGGLDSLLQAMSVSPLCDFTQSINIFHALFPLV